MKMPERLLLANLPTKIQKLESLSKEIGHNIWIKRDDQTGTEVSGNKVRKLEFAVNEALEQGCDYLITCGGIQSNHARATCAVAAKLGMGCQLVLRGSDTKEREGNLFLNTIMGAKIKFITPDEYEYSRADIMENLKRELSAEGHKAYILPEGASNGIGSFGYVNAYNEIIQQEKDLGFEFDAIVLAVGSGGTYAGMYYGNLLNDRKKDIIGINIAGDKEHFTNIISGLLEEINNYTNADIDCYNEDIIIIDGYPGLGYALSQPKEIDFIKHFACIEGIILDPVYTGKAMFGLSEEIKKGELNKYKNILFVHTGGLYGWTEEARKLI